MYVWYCFMWITQTQFLLFQNRFWLGQVFYLTSIYYPQPYFLDLTESKWKTKTECNYVNNKLGAKYGANELFGSVNFTDGIKLARWEFFKIAKTSLSIPSD